MQIDSVLAASASNCHPDLSGHGGGYSVSLSCPEVDEATGSNINYSQLLPFHAKSIFPFIATTVIRSNTSAELFSVWAGRWYVGRRRWSQKCGTCHYLKRHTVETKMIHVGSCLEHWLVISVQWNCGCMYGCSCSAITSKLFLCIFLILCNSMQSSPSMQAAVIHISL